MAVPEALTTTTKYALGIVIGITFVSIVFALLPTISLPDEIEPAIGLMAESLMIFNFIIPVSSLFLVLKLIIIIEASLVGIKGLSWIYGRLFYES